MKLSLSSPEAKVIELGENASVHNKEHIQRDESCVNHLRAILLEDVKYAQQFGEEIAEAFVNPVENINPYATFMIGLYQTAAVREPNLEDLHEEISSKKDLKSLIKFTGKLPEGTRESKLHKFERRTHLSFLKAIGVEKREIHESEDHQLLLRPNRVARPLLAQLIRQDEYPSSKILQVNYSLADSN